MARRGTSYKSEKRKKELQRLKKQEEKRKRRLGKADQPEGEPAAEAGEEAGAEEEAGETAGEDEPAPAGTDEETGC